MIDPLMVLVAAVAAFLIMFLVRADWIKLKIENAATAAIHSSGITMAGGSQPSYQSDREVMAMAPSGRKYRENRGHRHQYGAW